MMMSGNDCWNKNVFSRWRKVEIEGDDWTWTAKVFRRVAAATGNDMTERTARVSWGFPASWKVKEILSSFFKSQFCW